MQQYRCGNVKVCLAKSTETPFEVGSPSPKVSKPEPAFTKVSQSGHDNNLQTSRFCHGQYNHVLNE